VDDAVDDVDDDKKAVDPDDIKLDRLIRQASKKKPGAITTKGKGAAKGKK
jgi:hypothetical protein